ncbi:MAG: type VII toxin-antitoxin system HepT family RNase toxin [Sarcina sp.]
MYNSKDTVKNSYSTTYNKIASIERGVKRIREVYDSKPGNLEDYTKQDSIILNIQRACECSIDLAMHIVSDKRLGVPQTSRDAFEVLESNGIIDKSLASKMKPMVGLRNIAVHDYQKVNLKIVEMIIEKHLSDFEEFVYCINKNVR